MSEAVSVVNGIERPDSLAKEASIVNDYATDDVIGSISTPALAVENVVEPAAESTEVERGHLEDIHFEVEVALSDWGLARFPFLLEGIRGNVGGYISIASLLEVPSLKALKATEADIARSLQKLSSEVLELHVDQRRVRRIVGPRESSLAFSPQQWAEMTLYVEGLPFTGRRRDTTPASIRSFLSRLFSSPVQTVRFPPHYDKHARSQDRTPAADATLYELHPHWQDLDRSARRALRLPVGGGSFAGFAFIVLAEKEAVDRVLHDWPFRKEPSDTGIPQTTSTNVATESDANCCSDDSDGAEDDGDVQSVLKEDDSDPFRCARQSGLKVMRLADWNKLKESYLTYKRALQKLEDEYEERSWREQDRYRDRERYDRNTRRRRDVDFWSAKPRSRFDEEELEPKPQPSDAARWGHRSATPETGAAERIPGSLVSLRHINSSAKAVAIRHALNALLTVTHPEKGSVVHVDLASGSIRATVRCTSAETAEALVQIFAGDPRTHSDPHGENEDAFDLMDPLEESPMVKAAMLDEAEEKAYWAEVSRHAANAGAERQVPTSKRRGDGLEKPKSKHTRFD